MIALCDAGNLAESLTVPDDALGAIVRELYKSLSAQKLLSAVFETTHMQEEADQLRLLKGVA